MTTQFEGAKTHRAGRHVRHRDRQAPRSPQLPGADRSTRPRHPGVRFHPDHPDGPGRSRRSDLPGTPGHRPVPQQRLRRADPVAALHAVSGLGGHLGIQEQQQGPRWHPVGRRRSSRSRRRRSRDPRQLPGLWQSGRVVRLRQLQEAGLASAWSGSRVIKERSRIEMAKNTGEGHREGEVRDRSQVYNPADQEVD